MNWEMTLPVQGKGDLHLKGKGQAPHTAIIGCADSRVPLETIFDSMPGDLFALRNAGNTCTHAEGSMVGSLEFCTGGLGTRMVLVLGHTTCASIYGATSTYFNNSRGNPSPTRSALDGLLYDLSVVAEQAAYDMGPHAAQEDVAAHAVRINVFHTIDFLLKFSKSIRERVSCGQVEIQGALYHMDTGVVEFMGRSPRQSSLLTCKVAMPPSVEALSSAASPRGRVRTGVDNRVPALEALNLLKEGNERFAVGAPISKMSASSMVNALASAGQAPFAAILGSADSRAPIDSLFDAMPGDLFVLRNAGNTCTHAEGSMVGSLEFCVSKLGTRLILVLGHTDDLAVRGALATHLYGSTSKSIGSALEGLLMDLTSVAEEACKDLGPFADLDQLAAHAVRVNVFHSVNFLLKFSETLRGYVRSGELMIQGGIYHLSTGRVEFLGRSPQQQELLSSSIQLPPSMSALPIRTTGDDPILPEQSLQLLKAGNERFAVGMPLAGGITAEMRKALAREGQAPHSAIVGCADSRAALEAIFDAMPGDLFVLRNVGNSFTHAEGSVMGSLEFCTGTLQTPLILILGHTSCAAIKGATHAYLNSTQNKVNKAGRALGSLLEGLSTVAQCAAEELDEDATEDEIADLAVQMNVFHTMDYLLTNSAFVRDQVQRGEVDIQGGIYNLESGRVNFLGRSPNQSKIINTF
eukprot:s5585_g1.t2